MPSLSSSSGNDVNIKVSTSSDNKGIDDTKKGLGDVSDQADRTGSRFSEFGKVAAIAVTAVSAAVVGFAAESVKAFEEEQKVTAQTAAVIKSTGDASGVTAQQVHDLAVSLQNQTAFSDDAVQSGENMLLTFTSIGKDIFPQATSTILDMSTALGQDLQSSAIQLGKALNDPINGVTALRRVGVQFTDSQKEQIKTLVDSGKTMDAQKLILQELQREFGGSAKAAGDTFAGQMERAKNQLDEFKKSTGEFIVEGLTPVIKGFLDWVDSMGGVEGIAKKVHEWTDGLATSINNVAAPIANYLLPKLDTLFKSINENIIPVLGNLWHNVIEPLIPVIGTTLVLAIGAALDALTFISNTVGDVSKALNDGNPFVWALAAAFGGLAASMAFNAIFDAMKVGFATLELITIPNAMASVGAFKNFISSPTVMGNIAVAGALADIALVVKAVQAAQQAIQAMNDAATAQSNLQQINASIKTAAAKATAEGNTAKAAQLNKIANSNNTKAPSAGDYISSGLGALVNPSDWAQAFGFSTGGYTGRGGVNDVAGIVHKGEYVVPQSQVDQSTGLPKMGGGGNTFHIENFNVNSADAMEVFLNAQDDDQRMVLMGLTPNRGNI